MAGLRLAVSSSGESRPRRGCPQSGLGPSVCLIFPRVYTKRWMSAGGSRWALEDSVTLPGDLAAEARWTRLLSVLSGGLLSRCLRPQPRFLSTVHLTSAATGTLTVACCCLLPGAEGWRERRKGPGGQGESKRRPSIFSSEAQRKGFLLLAAQKSILPASVCKLVTSLRGLEKHFVWRSQDVNPGNPTHVSKHLICQMLRQGIF